MRLINTQTGQIEEVPQDGAFDLLSSGSHNFVAGETINAVDPGGKLVSIPSEQAPEALQRFGFRLPAQADIEEYKLEEKYGNRPLEAGLLGAARGTTFSISDALLSGTGIVESSTLRELKKRNEDASTIGELGGATVGAIAGPAVLPVRAAAKLGVGLAERLAPAALTEGAGIAARLAQAGKQIGAVGAGSAVEGAFYGAGESVQEAALGDPQAAAENLAANIGFGALVGGGLGATVKAGALAVPGSFGAAKNAISRFYDRMIGRPAADAAGSVETVAKTGGSADILATAQASTPPPDWAPSPASRAIASLSGRSEPEARTLLQASHEVELMTPEARDVFVRELTDSIQTQYSAVEKATKEAITKVRPQESAELLMGADVQAAEQASSKAIAQLRHAVAEMRTNPDLHPPRFPAKAELILDGLEDRVTGKGLVAADHFNAINQAKQSLDKVLRFGKDITGEAQDSITLLRDLRGVLRAGLEEEKTWGAAAARQAAFNASNHDLATATTALRKRLMQKVETKGGRLEYKVNPTKVQTYVNQINNNRARPVTEALVDYFKAAKSHIEEIGKTYDGAPFETGAFDRVGLTGAMTKTEAAAMRAKSILEAQPGGHGAHTDWFHPLSNVGRTGIAAAIGGAVAGPPGAIVGGAIEMASTAIKGASQNPGATVAKLANIERAAQKTAKQIERTGAGIFKAAQAGAVPPTGTIMEMTLEDRRDQMAKRAEPIHEFMQTADGAADKLHEWTLEAGDAAPNIAGALQQVMIRGMSFLSEKLPRDGAMMALDKPRAPSAAELTRFDRYYDAVHDPISVFRGLKSNILTNEGLEAVKTVYPKLYDDMRFQIIRRLGEKAAQELTYQRRLILGKFLGEPLDSSMTPPQIQANQAALSIQRAEREAKEEAERNFRPEGTAAIDQGQRTMTNTDKTAQRAKI